MASFLTLCQPCYSSFSSSWSSKRAITDQIFPGTAFFNCFQKACVICCMLACMNCSIKVSLNNEFGNQKKRLNSCLLKNFETKITNLVSDLFILGRIPTTIRQGRSSENQNLKTLLRNKENNTDIAQARLRLYSVTH